MKQSNIHFLITLLIFFSVKAAEERTEPVGKWGFFDLCKHVYDPETSLYKFTSGDRFDPASVKKGDIILIRGRKVDEFFATLDPLIAVPYILITHGEYKDGFTSEFRHYLDNPKIIAWFTIHPTPERHPKLLTIPLGILPIKNKRDERDKQAQYLMQLRRQEKSQLLYINFSLKTHPDRPQIKKLFVGKSFCHFGNRTHFENYLKTMARFKFTLSPPGLGPDCYRTWEALLVGSIPIIKTSYLDYLYEDLPVLIVNSWSEVTEEYLLEKYATISKKDYNLDKLFIDYWASKIQSLQDRFIINEFKKCALAHKKAYKLSQYDLMFLNCSI